MERERKRVMVNKCRRRNKDSPDPPSFLAGSKESGDSTAHAPNHVLSRFPAHYPGMCFAVLALLKSLPEAAAVHIFIHYSVRGKAKKSRTAFVCICVRILDRKQY